jgi:hypothetical protein
MCVILCVMYITVHAGDGVAVTVLAVTVVLDNCCVDLQCAAQYKTRAYNVSNCS